MKVILNTDVPNLGEEGDIREVKRGYARNFLVPRMLAMPYNKQSMAEIDSRRAAIEKRKETKKQQAASMKERIEGLLVNLTMPAGDNGRLFGAVTSATIADELAKLDLATERKRIEIPEHTIKASGNYRVKIRLYGNEEASLRVAVNQPVKAEDGPVADAPATSEAATEAGASEAPTEG
ncbi:MAG TPA: 50S ribosomal protein L9 [Spirochaetia bacterium]|nr:50S ribosomal protein L9 [Spirochaetia bacterium]